MTGGNFASTKWNGRKKNALKLSVLIKTNSITNLFGKERNDGVLLFWCDCTTVFDTEWPINCEIDNSVGMMSHHSIE